MRPYYEAYEERYRAIHEKGLRWAGERPTPIVAETAARYCPPGAAILEIGCGLTDGSYIEITEGLEEGEHVIVS